MDEFEKSVRYVNKSTGEIIAQIVTSCQQEECTPKPPRKVFNYMQLFKRVSKAVAEDTDLKKIHYRILLHCFGELFLENELILPAALIASYFNVSRQHASSAIKLLVDKHVLIKNSQAGINSYKLNPRVGWYGRFNEDLSQYPEVVHFEKK